MQIKNLATSPFGICAVVTLDRTFGEWQHPVVWCRERIASVRGRSESGGVAIRLPFPHPPDSARLWNGGINMDADSASELRPVLEALEARLREAAGWIKKKKAHDDESPCRVFGPKRLALVLDAFRDALNAGAFADDEVMQDERARAFPEDFKEPAEESPPIELRVPFPGHLIFHWSGYTSSGDGTANFIERLLRGWLPSFDFGKPHSQSDVVEVPCFRVLTVKVYACGLRCLAHAVRVEIDRRCDKGTESEPRKLIVELGGTDHKPPEIFPPPQLRDELRQFAEEKMRGVQRRVVETLCAGDGPVLMKDLASETGIEWDMPCKQEWDSAKKGIDAKIKPRFGLMLTSDRGMAAFKKSVNAAIPRSARSKRRHS